MIPGLNKRSLNFYDLMLYVAVVRKHIRLMVLLVCMSLLCGLILYVYSRPIYFSRSIVQVDSLSLPLDTDKVYHDSSVADVISELRGPEVIERTAARLGIQADHAVILTKYIRELRITPNLAGNLDVQVWSYIPAWPARWTQVMVEEFTKLRAEKREQYSENLLQTYRSELGEIKSKIDAEQQSKSAFEDQTNFTQAAIDAESLRNLPGQIARTKERLDQLETIRSRLDKPGIDTIDRLAIIASADAESPVQLGQAPQSQMGTSASITGSAAGQEADDPVVADSVIVPGLIAETVEWQRLDKRQRDLLTEQANLLRTYLPGSQKMAPVEKELEDVQRSLDEDYQIARKRFDIVCRTLQDHYTDLQKKLPDYEAAIRKYASIQEEAQLRQNGALGWAGLYNDADKTIAQTEFTNDKEKVKLEFGHMVDLKPNPVSPNKLKLGLLSLAMGLGLAVAIPFLIEYLDYTLSNLEQVEATFQMRGLGIIPQIPHEPHHPVLLDVSAAGGERNLIENFRIVRTNLLAMGALSKEARVTMVTSSVPKEGKTVVSTNLAISFGQTGARTLLIDTDLRRGRLHRLFGLRKSPGLSDYLLGKVPLEEAIRPSGKENLSILSAGQHIESGTELLGSDKFTDLMIRLRLEYDRIIVDTPPVLGLSETSVLQKNVDGILWVIWSGRTPIREMKTAIDTLAANGANFYGFILNRLDLTATANYYQYYYYSSDYYHSYHAIEQA